MSRVTLCIVQCIFPPWVKQTDYGEGLDFCGYAINVLRRFGSYLAALGGFFLPWEAQPQVVWLPGAAVTDVGWKSLSCLLNLNSEPYFISIYYADAVCTLRKETSQVASCTDTG